MARDMASAAAQQAGSEELAKLHKDMAKAREWWTPARPSMSGMIVPTPREGDPAPYPETIKRGSLADQIKAAKEPPQWDKTTYAFNPAVERQWTPDTPNLLYALDTTGLAPGDSEEDWCHTPAGKEWLKANGV
jgi:hypothetical protein